MSPNWLKHYMSFQEFKGFLTKEGLIHEIRGALGCLCR